MTNKIVSRKAIHKINKTGFFKKKIFFTFQVFKFWLTCNIILFSVVEFTASSLTYNSRYLSQVYSLKKIIKSKKPVAKETKKGEDPNH